MHTDGDLFFVTLLFGPGLLYLSYKLRQVRDRLRTTRFSTIDEVEIGQKTKVVGKVFCSPVDLVVSPLTGTECAAFEWTIRSRSSAQDDSDYQLYHSAPFVYVTDDSGHLAAIDIIHADFDGANDETAETVFEPSGAGLPEAVVAILLEQKLLDPKSRKNYGIRESLIMPDEEFLIFGATEPTPAQEKSPHLNSEGARTGTRQTNLDLLAQKKFLVDQHDTYIVSNYDTNRNLVLDINEKNRLLQDIKAKISEELKGRDDSQNLKRSRFIFTKAQDADFAHSRVHISTENQRVVIRKLNKQIRWTFIGGVFTVLVFFWNLFL